jgi:hypothetical protein
MSDTDSVRTFGFGVPDAIDPHHFVVRIPSGNAGDIEIIEDFGINSPSRLREKKLKASRWSAGDNKVERLLGRELCLLAWAVEKARLEDYPVACASWVGLAPEERWWLFRMCDASGGTADDIDVGWRKAVRIGMTEVAAPGTRKRRKAAKPSKDTDLFSLPLAKDY